jgi:Dockerin type I domain/Kelch motif/Galactose oxidase, central domain
LILALIFANGEEVRLSAMKALYHATRVSVALALCRFALGGTSLTSTPIEAPCSPVASWTEQAPYPIVISGNAVASVGGNVYSFGGIANNVAIANAYKYSPSTNTWAPIASLPTPRGWFSGASDGTYIYLLGGVDQNYNTTATLWRYDPATDTYNTSLPSYTIPTYFHASAYLNGKIYRIAGAAIGTDYHVEVYDIATNSWSMAANYPFANHNLMAAALGSYIYAGGGNASPDKTYRYDPSTNTWDDAAIADLPAGRSSAASGVYNGRWLLAGGDVNFAISNSVIAWDPATNTWNNLPNMIQARDNLEGATAGQSFYAVAGDSGPGTPTNDNQQYTEPAPVPVSAASRMTHGAAGDFGVNLPFAGTAGIESRSKGGTNDYTMAVTFSGNVVVNGSPQAQVTLGTATIGSNGINNGGMVTVSGNIVTIPLTNVANDQTINIRLNGVNGADAPAIDVTIPMSVLIGDVNANGVVNASDVASTKAQLGQPVSGGNFRTDVNANGFINATDVSLVKAAVGTALR